VLIPAENEKDLRDLPKSVTDGLEIIPVSHVSEVLKHALISTPESIDWDEAAEDAAAAALAAERGRRRWSYRALSKVQRRFCGRAGASLTPLAACGICAAAPAP
jgi:hypothetical protein